MSEFCIAPIEAALVHTQFSKQLIHLPQVESTNTIALEAAQAGARSGVWVADEQLAGRGRGGHAWHSAHGEGLYVTALITPALPIDKALWLSLATGLAVRSAIAATTGLVADIRWPNDMILNGRKCGGILVETAVDANGMLRHAVIGIGLNVAHTSFPAELEAHATSLRRESGVAPQREVLLAALLTALDEQIHLLLDEHAGDATAPGLLARFTAASTWVTGKHVTVAEAGGYTGITSGLDKRGFLRVRTADGVVHTVLSGSVRSL